MVDWAELAEKEDNDDTYYKWLTRIGRRNCWQPDKRFYHADDIAVSQSFLDLYRKYKDEAMIIPTARYFTYRRGGETRFVLLDDGDTLHRKIALGERLGIHRGLLTLPELSLIHI